MKITRVLHVEDTRQWEEGPGDRWYPIPGSGIKNNCGRCGREHEVHATVETSADGVLGSMIVGTGCMKADEGEVAAQIRSILSAQRTLAKNERLLAKYESLSAQDKAIRDAVEKLPMPPIEATKWNPIVSPHREISGFKMGRALISSDQMAHPTHTEKETLEYLWRADRSRELGQTYEMTNASANAGTVRKQILKIKQRIKEKIDGSICGTEGS